MKKRVLSLFAAFFMLCSVLSCLSFDEMYFAKASGVDNIVARANYMYNSTWVAQKDVLGWNDYTFKKGTTYRIPYGQPVSEGGYIGFAISVIVQMSFILKDH